MKIIGEIETKHYSIRVQTTMLSQNSNTEETPWIYITKRRADGTIGRQSIGIDMSRLQPLIQILSVADANYYGNRQEFKKKDDEC